MGGPILITERGGYTAIVHVIVGIMAIGYAQAYYFHLRMKTLHHRE